MQDDVKVLLELKALSEKLEEEWADLHEGTDLRQAELEGVTVDEGATEGTGRVTKLNLEEMGLTGQWLLIVPVLL